jgi:hypothetical protein
MPVLRIADAVPAGRLVLVLALALSASALVAPSRANQRAPHVRAAAATTLDDRALTRAGGWKSLTQAKAYRQTLSKSRKKGASLTSPTATTAGGSVRLQFGPSRGKVAIWVGGVKRKTVKTARASKKLVTVAFTGSGTVRLLVTRQRQGVYVDQLTVVPPPPPPPPATTGQVVITEFMADPVGSDADQDWIELTNATAGSVPLGGCVIGSNQPGGTTLPTGLAIAPHGIILLARSSDPSRNGGLPTPAAAFTFNLLDTAYVTLSCGGSLVDQTATLPGTNTHTKGRAVQLSTDWPTTAVSNDDATHWCDAQGTYGTDGNYGTPGAANTPCF